MYFDSIMGTAEDWGHFCFWRWWKKLRTLPCGYFLNRDEHRCSGGCQSISLHSLHLSRLINRCLFSMALSRNIRVKLRYISLGPHRNGGCQIHLLPWCLTSSGFLSGPKHPSSRKWHGNWQMTFKANRESSSWCHLRSSFKQLDLDKRGDRLRGSVTSMRLGSCR